jgi:NADH-quinone oxidoreductase subunit M
MNLPQFLLTFLIFSPLIGVPLVLALDKRLAKTISFGISLIPFVASIVLYLQYLGMAGENMPLNDFVIAYSQSWIGGEGVDISYSLGIDGISIYLVLLTTLIFPISILFSSEQDATYPQGYHSLLLILETGVLGFFMATDMLLFYIFFEMVLIPMYFLIGIWGGKERIYASIKFFLYTLVGSLLMLIAVIYMGLHVEGMSFSTSYEAMQGVRANISPTTQIWLFLAFALSFAIKVPLFPLHTWLPDAHTQAPTAGSVILAAVLLKMGTYGLVRFCLPLFPEASYALAPYMSALAVVGIIYGAMAAMVQTDVKKLVAYSSVSHLGFIVLGIFALTEEAMSGAVIQMVSHGVATGGLFLLVGMIYDRRHSREIKDFQGIAKQVPIFTFIFMITVMASVGLPGLNGFVGEFLVLIGSFHSDVISGVFPILAATGVVIAAVYLLWMFRRVMFGELDKEANRKLTDLTGKEIGLMMPLLVLMFWMGLYATPFLRKIENSSNGIVKYVLEQQAAGTAQLEKSEDTIATDLVMETTTKE